MQVAIWHIFPPHFDWQNIIGSDHRLFLNNQLVQVIAFIGQCWLLADTLVHP